MKKRRRIVWLAALILLALAGASMLLSKYGLEVTRLELGFDGLPAGFDGFKIVQLSDLHGSSFGQDNEKLIKKIREEEPELIALTGDFLDEGKAGRELPELSGLVSELIRIAPVYFVSGNHDWASGEVHTLFETLEEAGAVCLRNEYLTLERNGSRRRGGPKRPRGYGNSGRTRRPAARLGAGELRAHAGAPGLLGGKIPGARCGPHPLRPHSRRHRSPAACGRTCGLEHGPLPGI